VFIDAVHPDAGTFTHVTLPALVNGKRSTEIRHHAPALGEQTDEILTEAGLTTQQIAELRESGVVGG
jgi:crotonobetainyl-CoA:carnitine CoA-transferase CaiB-like acyl-CoA transferase